MSGPSSLPLRFFMSLRRGGYRFDNFKRRYATIVFKTLLRMEYGSKISYDGIEDFNAEVRTAWKELPPAPIELTIVVVTYRQPVQLKGLLASLQCQTLQNFEVLVIHDGPDEPTRKVLEQAREASDRYAYLETETRYNDYGHSLRELGLSMAKGEYVLITNGDNYYVPRFTEFVFEAVQTRSLDMITWDIVHSYCHPGKTTMRSYNPFRVYPVHSMVDMGSVMVRTSIAQRAGFEDKSHAADASYVENILSLPGQTLKIGKVEKTLMVHN